MSKRQRNFSPAAYWSKLVENWEPLLRFKGATPAEWEHWRKDAQVKFMELLGSFPAKVPLQAEVESSVVDGEVIRERVVLDTEAFMSVPCQVLRPRAMRPDHSHAAILCSHGHGPHGKDPVAGIRAYSAEIAAMNYDYGWQMARAGFLTIMPDLRGFGERHDGDWQTDTCNGNFVKGALLGVSTLTLNIHDLRVCIDYLQTRAEVDPERIGMMGLSQGGTMTTFTTAADPRIKAADIIGYVNSWTRFAIQRDNCCGSQIVPHMYRYLDVDDIAGLIAPRPLLLEMGIYDTCFFIQDLLAGYEHVKQIYTAAGVEDRLWADIFPGPHAFGGNKAVEFFKKFL